MSVEQEKEGKFFTFKFFHLMKISIFFIKDYVKKLERFAKNVYICKNGLAFR